MAKSQGVSVARVRRHGLRILCLVCGKEYRHRFEIRLRLFRSPCCKSKTVPAWHVAKDQAGRPLHPEHYRRAIRKRQEALTEQRQRELALI